MPEAPLSNIRIIDLTLIWAGPFGTSLLADMGAEVIKVESCRREDPVRYLVYPNEDPGEEPWNRGGYFHRFNRNKYGMTLNLTHSEGVRVFKQLVAVGDVVIENYSPRVMRNFGLDYPVLRAIKPDLIMVSMPFFGSTGPYRDYTGVGSTAEAMAGVSHGTGYEGGPPLQGGIALGDPVAGLHAAFALLAALHYRQRTGEGQYIDLSQLECLSRLVGDSIMEYTLNGRVRERVGNRHPYMAPHGCYPCQGEDSWIVIAVRSDEEWRCLCDVMGRPDLAEDPRFQDAISRWQNQDALRAAIGEWTVRFPHYELFELLQKAGIAAGPVLSNKEVLEDPHLAQREFFQPVDHPAIGRYRHVGVWARLSKTPGRIERAAPLLGQHNGHVLQDLLGLTPGEMQRLEGQGIIGTRPEVTLAGSKI